jgi:hypothetical protein
MFVTSCTGYTKIYDEHGIAFQYQSEEDVEQYAKQLVDYGNHLNDVAKQQERIHTEQIKIRNNLADKDSDLEQQESLQKDEFERQRLLLEQQRAMLEQQESLRQYEFEKEKDAFDAKVKSEVDKQCSEKPKPNVQIIPQSVIIHSQPIPPIPQTQPRQGVVCCDGSISGCSYVHRGCCSHHGGVC